MGIVDRLLLIMEASVKDATMEQLLCEYPKLDSLCRFEFQLGLSKYAMMMEGWKCLTICDCKDGNEGYRMKGFRLGYFGLDQPAAKLIQRIKMEGVSVMFCVRNTIVIPY